MIDVDEAANVRRLLTAGTVEQLEPLDLVDHAAASSLSNGGTRNVTSSNTSTNTPPRPNMTTGPNSSSVDTPTTRLDAALDHLAYEHAVDRGLLVGLLGPFEQFVVRPFHLGGRCEADSHEAEIGLVERSGDETFMTTG